MDLLPNDKVHWRVFSVKNKRILDTSFCIAYIVMSYIFLLWYSFEFKVFEIETPSAIKFLITYTIFIIFIFYFLKFTNSNIVTIIIFILSILYLKEYSNGPIETIVNRMFTKVSEQNPILTFGFAVQTMIVILNLVILFFAILKMHEWQESKRK